ncbi:MAG: substrate-binding domain-containing protein [Candidatus Eremiobacteraeota bacterium]|nr:substrate-binding domain-containing protein [Candidatus Eremiobacteraeota bacterium]MCW5870573.1 substrate-binding domain-containing protein [Candidatus Eremiobacteraeota bacterium]
MPLKRVAFLVDLSNSFGRKILEGVHSHPARHNWMLLAESWGDVGWEDLNQVDGILVDHEEPELVKLVRASQRPIVDLSGALEQSGCSRVTVDYAQVGRVAAEHLKDRGFTNLAYLGLKRWAASQQIAAGFLQNAAEFAQKIERHKTLRRWSGQNSRHLEELTGWLASLPVPCGILAADDVTARRVLHACRRLERPVPQQMAVLGVGDYEMVTVITDPPLSSVIVPAREIGFQAADCLNVMLNGDGPRQVRLPIASIAARRSTDSLAWADPLICAALEWLNEHSGESLRVPALAEHLSVSRRLLEQRFRNTLGHGPAEQLRRIRLRRAGDLLRETDLNLDRIAKMSGLGTAEHLCVLFRQYTGLTPGSYRTMLSQHPHH